MTKSNQINFYSEIGDAIREARNNVGLSQEYVSLKVKKSRASIVNIEKGRQHAPLHLLWDLAYVLNVKITDLIPNSFISKENEIESVFEKKINKTADKGHISEESKEKINSFISQS